MLGDRIFDSALRKTSTARLQLDALDGLRGLAVLLVVASHLSNGGFDFAPRLNMSGTGKYGVYLFFTLSAFLLTLPLLSASAMRSFEGRQWAGYALRRVLRIYPLYFCVLSVDYAVTLAGGHPAFTPMPTDSYIAHLLLQEGRGLYWTIPVEFKYYLALPFVALLYARVLKGKLLPAALATAALIGASLFYWPAAEIKSDTLQLGPYLPIFLMGSLAALVYSKLPKREAASTSARLWQLGAWVCLFVVISLVPALAAALSGEAMAKSQFHSQFLLFGVLWSLLLLCTLRGGGVFAWLAKTRGLRLFGVVSFSVYLWHMPILKGLVLAGVRVPYLTAWFALAIISVVALLSWRCIEAPFTRGALAKKWLGKLRPHSAQESV